MVLLAGESYLREEREMNMHKAPLGYTEDTGLLRLVSPCPATAFLI